MQCLSENSLLAEVSHDEAKMSLSFLPRRERPLLAGKSEKNCFKKHFASSRTGSSEACKRTLVAGKEELNFEDLQEGCNQLLK